MKYLRHIVLFSGILVIVAFFTRISRHALYDGYFSKIEELNMRNSQECGTVRINLPLETEDFIEIKLIRLKDTPLWLSSYLFKRQGIFLSSIVNEYSNSPQIFNDWIMVILIRQLPGFSQAP
jgi:hypothetical protein